MSGWDVSVAQGKELTKVIQEELARLPEDVSEAEKLRVIEAAEEEAALNPEFGKPFRRPTHTHPTAHPTPSTVISRLRRLSLDTVSKVVGLSPPPHSHSVLVHNPPPFTRHCFKGCWPLTTTTFT